MGYVLLDARNPNAYAAGYQGFWGHPTMRYAPQAIVLHTTESLRDEIPPDSGAENVARWFTTNNVRASYHTIVDSDSTVDCLPAGLDGTVPHTAFHCYDYNSFTLGLSFALQASTWPEASPGWVTAALERGADVVAAWCRRWAIPANLVTKSEVDGDVKGITYHGRLNPGDRSDPGAQFPAERFLALVRARLNNATEDDEVRPCDWKTEDVEVVKRLILEVVEAKVTVPLAAEVVRQANAVADRVERALKGQP